MIFFMVFFPLFLNQPIPFSLKNNDVFLCASGRWDALIFCFTLFLGADAFYHVAFISIFNPRYN